MFHIFGAYCPKVEATMSEVGMPTDVLAVSARHWTGARILVALVAAFTIVGALIADAIGPMAAQHLSNPNWSPHAKFHDAQYIVMSMLLGLIALVLVSQKRGDTHRALVVSSAILATPWLGMFGALLFPGTSMRDPEFDVPSAYVLGTHPQILTAAAALTVLLIAVALAMRRHPTNAPTV
jgi:hypothetical protein